MECSAVNILPHDSPRCSLQSGSAVGTIVTPIGEKTFYGSGPVYVLTLKAEKIS